MAQSEITFEFRTTWVILAVRLFAWMESKTLLKLLDNAIYARLYCNGKLKNELRLPMNQMIEDYERQA